MEEIEACREAERVRQQERQSNMSIEEIEASREAERVRQQERRSNMSMEEIESSQEAHRIRKQERRSNLSMEEIEAWQQTNRIREHERRRNMAGNAEADSAETDLLTINARLRQQIARQKRSPEQLQMMRERNRERMALLHHQQQRANEIMSRIERNSYGSNIRNKWPYDISQHIEIEECIESCQKSLNQIMLTENENEYEENTIKHKMLVCVVCDHAITGKEIFNWIEDKTLQFHNNILSYSYFYKDGMNEILKDQYTLPNEKLHGLLLSPRSRFKILPDTTNYMCCQNCYEELKELKKRKRPPKYAISNGFAIGHLPEGLADNITPLVNNLVAPIRAFNYFIAFSGGREKKITGNFTFFAQDVSHNVGALQHMALMNNNPSIFLVLLRSFTTSHLDKIRTKGSYNVDTFRKIYHFLRENNEHYALLPTLDQLPMPRVEQINMNENEEDTQIEDSVNPTMENQLCWKYWFPAVEDPNNHSAIYKSQTEFAEALFGGYTPTMFYHPTKVISYAKLSELCPIAFPFGTGDIDNVRSPPVSEVECLQHYLRLSLPQMLEGQTVLIIHHFFQRRKSFLSGITKCNMTHNGNSIATQLADISIDELDHAIREMRNMPPKCINSHSYQEQDISPHVKELMKCIKTSCTPIGYTNEAAAEARTKMFALWMTFGSPSLFFTFSPCDECSFKMQLFATMKAEELPSIILPKEIISRKLSLRRSLRINYPGACAREFDSLLQIILSDLIGWEKVKFKKNGIFGKVIAHGTGVEEQGRTTLHGHIILYIQNILIYNNHSFQMM